MTTAPELIATLLALAYVVMAIRENRWCFLLGGLSAALYLWIFWQVQLYMESLLQIFYIAISAYGWLHWAQAQGSALPITQWLPRDHLIAAVGLAMLTAMLGFTLGHLTDAAWPYGDSFTTVAALLATAMTAQKVLESWLYWVVIDLVSVALYIDRGLHATALLFTLYIVLALAGYWQWRQHVNVPSAA